MTVATGQNPSNETTLPEIRTVSAVPPWQPRIPLARVAPGKVAKATKLMAVFLPLLEKRDSRLSQAEWEAAANERYTGFFGHGLSGWRLRYLFKRTLERDRGAKNWHRLEIYLDDDICYVPPQKQIPAFDHSPLAVRLHFKNADKPSLAERQNVFELSFRHCVDMAAQHPGWRKEIKASLIRFLFKNAPGLSKSVKSITRNWELKYAEWTNGGCKPSAIADQRPVNSGNFNLQDLSEDLKLIRVEAWYHDGKISLAIRKLRRAGKLSQAFIDRYILDVRRHKSYIAKSIREQINRDLEGTLAFRRGSRAVRDAGPHIARSHDYQPGDYFAADDVTFNSYFWYIDDSGRPAVARGECLVWFDCRSLYPLGYILTPSHYNGEIIRRGMCHIHDRHGLPHKKFIYERGIWESRLVLGERRQSFLGWDEYEMNLRERGLEIGVENVTTPGAKLIEMVFNLLQQDMRNIPGFVGFSERDYAQESTQKLIGQVNRGTADPRGKFLSQEQICQAYDRAFESYLNEPQNGELLQGKSPAEMFAQHRPLRKLADNDRFLLASHRQRVKVKSDGIGLTIRGKRRFFYSEALGQRMGQDVLAWFNLECPDLLTVTDLDMKNPLSVRRLVIPAFDASKEQLAEAHKARAGFTKEARLRVDSIRHPIRNSITVDNRLDTDAQNLGAHIRKETEQFEAEQSEHNRLENRARRMAEENGFAAPEIIKNPARFMRGIELSKEAAEESAAEHLAAPGEAKTGAVKTYILDSAPSAQASPKLYWALWAKIEKIRPDLNRHALTRKALKWNAGPNPSPNAMTPAQLAKCLEVFSAILREAQEPAL